MTNPNYEIVLRSFVEMGKTLDFLRDVPIFDGNPNELMNWISDVEDVFIMYRDLPDDSLQFHLVERTSSSLAQQPLTVKVCL